MHIFFGSNFGFENVFPRLVNTPGASKHGHLQLGQKGLLELLELHLGLKTRDISDAIRISYYKTAISEAIDSNPNLYIKDSFEIDAWGTSKQLLSWRDKLQLALWDFKCENPQLERLYTISNIENFADNLPLGVNDRWKYIFEEIRTWKYDLPIKAITIYESKELINPFFTVLFEELAKKGIEVIWDESDHEVGNSDLGNFQKKLIATEKLDKVKLQNDGSLHVIKGENEKVIADALGELIISNQGNSPLFVIPYRGEILEAAFVQRGLPALGYTSTLEDSAFDQLLILITVFLWKPIDPERLIQYLTLPNAPIEKGLRLSLAKVYANKTSILNEEWKQAIHEYAEKHDKPLKKVQAKINGWFDRKKHETTKGAPSNDIISLFTDLKNWADSYKANLQNQDNLGSTQDDERIYPLKKLSNQCRSIIDLISSETKEKELINPIRLNKWLNALDEDSHSKSNQIEKGAFEFVTHSANITENTDELIYWNFLDPGNPISNYANWTRAELDELKNAYVHTSENIINQWYWQMSNAILRTKKKLILCIPSKSLGESLDAHPLYSDLIATFDSLENNIIEIDLNHETIEIGEQSINLNLYPKIELPKSQIAWNFEPSDKITKRENESFSSLSKLFYYPHAYFLNYQLGIKPIEIPEVSITPLLKGNIAHRTAEELWQIEDLLTKNENELLPLIQSKLEEIIETEGAVFLLPKNKVTLMEFQRNVQQSLWHLIRSIKDNGWSILETEQKHQAQEHIPLLGLIDLVLIRNEDEIAIVDLKWGGLSRKKKELLNEQELQLIIYDQLMKKDYPKIYLHYYIITSQEFVSRSNVAFKDSIVIGTDEVETLHRKSLWEKMVNTYRERWKQIENGQIEVGIELSTSEISAIFEMWKDEDQYLGMPQKSYKKEADRYSNYKNLIGN